MDKRRTIWLALAVFAICVAYANSFQNGFHFDDFHTVVDNPAIRTLHNIPRFFSDATTFSVMPPNRTYRPIVSTSLAIDYALGRGYSLFWFHVSTFILFLCLVFLLDAFYTLLLNQTKPSSANQWLALFAAAWFGLHPAIAETINYVIQRGDLYCTLGCVAALFLYARYPQLRRTGAYLLPFVFALLSKPPAAVFPLLLLLYIYFFDTTDQTNARRLRSAFIASVPAIVVTAVLLGLQSAMTPKSFLPSILSPADYRLTQPYVWLRYAAELFLPLHLNVDTDLTALSTLNLRACAGLLFFAALIVAIYITARRRTLYPIAFGLLWFVITQLPTSLYPLSEVENDHRMFFSFVGLILATVWAAWLLLERFTPVQSRTSLRKALIPVALVILCGYGYGVHRRNEVWRSEESLWRDDVAKSPHNGRGLMIYGLTQMSTGNYVTALDYFTRALVYTPNYPSLEINLGVVNGAMGNSSQAEQHFRRAINLAPNADEPHAFYGRWLSQQGRATDAIAQLRTAIWLNPLRAMQCDELILAYQRANDLDDTRKTAQDTLALIPGDTVALLALQHPTTPQNPSAAPNQVATLINRSLELNLAGNYEASIAAARAALKIDPNSAEAWNNIAAGNESLHRWDEAIAAASKAIALKPDFQLARNNLAWSQQQKSAAKSGGKP